VFLVVFALFLFVTLNVVNIPPGEMLYGLLGVPKTDYPVLGIPVTPLVIAIFNGVVCGFVAWFIFTLGMLGAKKEEVERPSLRF